MASIPPPCSACQAQPVAICASCVRKRLTQHRKAETTLQASLDRHTARASAALVGPGGLTEARLLEGELAARQRSVDRLQAEVQRLRSKLAADQARLGAQRATLADRRALLATLEAAPPATLPRALLELQLRSPDPYAPALLQTRQVLLSELLQVFNVRVYADDSDDDDDDDDDEEEDDFFKRSEGEDVPPEMALVDISGGRRRVNGGGGGRGEWMISNGLILPLPGDIHLYPAEQTNAALSATLHLLSLFATYLSPPLGLPFVPFLRPPSLQPSPRFSTSPLATTPDLAALLARHSARGIFPLQVPQRQSDLLLAGLAALQFDVAFLAAHVGVDIPLNESGLILYNLYRIALELASPVPGRAANTGGRALVKPVSLQRIALSLRGTLASSSGAAQPLLVGDAGGGPSVGRSRSEQRRAEAKDARRQAKDAVKATETAEEREERRTRRRAKRAERERRTRERDDWELVAGDSLESIRRG